MQPQSNNTPAKPPKSDAVTAHLRATMPMIRDCIKDTARLTEYVLERQRIRRQGGKP